MEIFWQPERGICSECGCGGTIRMLSMGRLVYRFCWPCWDEIRKAEAVPATSLEFADDEVVVYVYADEREVRAVA